MLSRLGAALVAETVGTFLFFFVGAGAVVLTTHSGDGSPGLVGVALAHGLALAVLVSAFGAISGGHFNPAVTVAVRLAGHITWPHAVMYVAAQLVGAAGAGFALRAVFPAGTLSGAPKVRAMQLIAELEGERRGVYGGAVGYLGYDGSLDTAIAIRSAVLTQGQIHVHSGAGIVAGSVPENEYDETEHKAAAMLRAIEMAAPAPALELVGGPAR